jgi:16S rRNA (uracil1498-N3)-methyltransferase
MRVPRIYIDQPLDNLISVELTGPTSHYIANVLRLRSGDKIIGFNGNGSEYAALLKDVKSKRVLISVESAQQPKRESSLRIHLGQGISRGERMDFVFQKAVELGAYSLTPLWTNRCQVQLTGTRLEKRMSHWRGIIYSACEQSGRVAIPHLHPTTRLDDWLCEDSDRLGIVLTPGASLTINELTRTARVRLLIGPEGGLDPEEIRRAEANGFTPVRLGPRVLRTETAAIAALTALQTLWGDLAI